MAVNAADPHHYSFSEQLLPLAVEKQMGIIGMKVPARGRILSSWTPPPIEQQKHMWEGMVLAPTAGTLDMRQAMYYSLSLPVSTVIIGCDTIAQLEQNVQLAREFTPLNQQQMAALTEKQSSAATKTRCGGSCPRSSQCSRDGAKSLLPRLPAKQRATYSRYQSLLAARPSTFISAKPFNPSWTPR